MTTQLRTNEKPIPFRPLTDYEQMVKQLIDEHGTDGADANSILKEEAEKRGFEYNDIVAD